MKPIDFFKNLVILQMVIWSSCFGHLTPPPEKYKTNSPFLMWFCFKVKKNGADAKIVHLGILH